MVAAEARRGGRWQQGRGRGRNAQRWHGRSTGVKRDRGRDEACGGDRVVGSPRTDKSAHKPASGWCALFHAPAERRRELVATRTWT